MKRSILFLFVMLFMASCNDAPKKEFSLVGTTNGIEDGSYMYLSFDNTVDSVKVENNKFRFQTKLPKSPIQAVLRSKEFFQYRFLWLENKAMTFDASKSDFFGAHVTGSEPESLSQSVYKIADSLPRQERIKLEMELVENNPNSIVSVSVLSVYCTTWGREKTLELFEPLSEENKKSEYGKKIANYIALNKEPKIGDSFVDFEMKGSDGDFKKLSDIKGKVILLEFWSSWCGPCRQENPNLVKSYQKYNPHGFEIFAVSLDEDKNSWLEAIKKDGLIWNHVSDLKGSGNKASLIYGITGIPDNFLIDENGVIVGRGLRGMELNEKLSKILN